MKVTIQGLRYNTERAKLIGEASYQGPQDDKHWWRAGLYRTPRGKHYFLAGEGAPVTRWAHRAADGTIEPGSGIKPLTPGEAREWAEYYLGLDEVEMAFGKLGEDA